MLVILGFEEEGAVAVDSWRRRVVGSRRWWRQVTDGAWDGREVGRRARVQMRRVGV